MMPIERVRCSKIGLPTHEVLELVARLEHLAASTLRHSVIQPHGRSSLMPPMRLKLGWKRPPVTASMRLSTYSRSRKP